MAIATIFTELDLDLTKFQAKQKTLLKQIEGVAKDSDLALQKGFMNLGVTSDRIYDLMVEKARVSYERINQSASASVAERTRAYAAYSQKIQSIDNERNAVQIAKEAERLAVAQQASEAAIALKEKENLANAQYWQARMRFEKDALAQSVLAQKQASEAVIALKEKENLANQQYWMAKMAYDKKAAAESVAAQATAQQQIRSMGLMQIAAIKEDADRTKAIQDKKKQDEEKMWSTMGIRSSAAINEQKAAVLANYDTLRAAASGNSTELVRLEKAKNEKLKELNKEMVGQHDWSMAAMTRAVLRFYAAWYVVSTAIGAVKNLVMGGVQAIDDLKMNTIAVASIITTMQGTTGNVVENYRKNLVYADALNRKLMEIDANTAANYDQLQLMNRAAITNGILFDANNQKQVESFTAISNTVAFLTKGQNQEIQYSQEINALMKGEVNSKNRVAQMIDNIIKQQGIYKGGLEEVVKIGKQNGDTWERLLPYFIGINAASEDISSTWAAVSSSLQTVWGIVQRGLFKDLYKDLTDGGRDAAEWMKKNADDIVRSIQNISTGLEYATKASLLFLGITVGLQTVTAAWAALSAAWTAGTIAITLQLAALSAWEFVVAGSLLKSVSTLGGAMKATAGVFAAFFVGWEIGGWLNNFEFIRKAGVNTVYGIIAAWEWFLHIAEVGWLKLKSFMPFSDKEQIKKDLEAAGKLYDDWVVEHKRKWDDQLRDQTKTGGKTTINPVLPKLPPRGPTEEEIKAAKKAAEEYRKIQEKSLQEELALFDKREEENAKYLEDMAKDRAEIEAKALAEELALFDKREEENQKYLDKMKEDAEKRAAAEIESWQKSGDAAVSAMEKEIAMGLKLSMQTIEKPQKDADEARKMVTFYQDMIGMEDEYRQAKLDWIKKEAAVKFDGMDKEVLKAKWVKDQTIKFEQEIFEAKSKKIEQGLGDMASMFQSISGMYDKSSGEYARMQEAANAMIVLQKAVAVVNAVSAVAASAAAPFPAGFVAMASMAAAMGSLLGSIGVSFSGGSSASAPAYAFSDTVLGAAAGTGSESIANSWGLLQDTYDMEDVKLTKIYEEMKSLNSNITGIVRGIITGNVGSMSVGDLGYSQSSMAGMFNGLAKISADLATIGSGIVIAGSALSGVLMASAAATPIGWAAMAALVVDRVLGLGIVDSVIGKISDFVFGSTETTQTASGIMIGGGTVKPYTQTHTESSGMFGGLFGGGGSEDSRSVGAVNEVLTTLFYGPNGIYTTLKSSVSSMATLLGADVAAAENKVFESFELNFLGKNAEDIEKMVSEKISEIGDKFATEVFGQLVNLYQQVGEGALETITRLTVDLVSVAGILDTTGKEMTSVRSDAVALSEALIGLAGGLDKLQEAASTYYDKFFTDAEKQIRLAKQLADNLGLVPGSRADYRKAVELLDLSNEADRERYVLMLQLAEAADQYYSTLEDATEEATRANEDYVKSLQNITLTIQAWLDNLSLSSLSPVQSEAEWTRQYSEAKAKASLSGASEQDVSAYLSFATKYLEMQQKYGTATSYKAIYDAVVGDVEGMGAGKDLALEIAQKQLDALNLIVTNTAVSATASIAPPAGGEIGVSTVGGISKIPNTTALYMTTGGFPLQYNGHGLEWYNPNDDSDVWDWEDGLRMVQPNYPNSVFAEGGYHEGGWRMVGERGPELEYTPPSRIFSNKQTRSMLAGIDANGGEVTVHSHIYLDGKEIQTCVSKGFKTNSDLIQSARRAVNE